MYDNDIQVYAHNMLATPPPSPHSQPGQPLEMAHHSFFPYSLSRHTCLVLPTLDKPYAEPNEAALGGCRNETPVNARCDG